MMSAKIRVMSMLQGWVELFDQFSGASICTRRVSLALQYQTDSTECKNPNAETQVLSRITDDGLS
jgi:hypothetical protein